MGMLEKLGQISMNILPFDTGKSVLWNSLTGTESFLFLILSPANTPFSVLTRTYTFFKKKIHRDCISKYCW